VVSDLLRHERDGKRRFGSVNGWLVRVAMQLGGSRLAHVAAFLLVPRSSVVGLRGRIKSRVETVLRQFETVVHDQSSAGVIEQVILSYAVILDDVVDHSAEECNVGAGSNLKEEIRGRRGARKARI